MEYSSDYWAVRGDTIDEAIARLNCYTKDDLIRLVVNNRLNDFVAHYADYGKDEEDEHGHGKRVPYIGWFWRATDFIGGRIPIGRCEFIGVMENNKWDYPERYLTPKEVEQVVNIVWEAKKLSEAGGEIREIRRKTTAKLAELWDLLQTFEV